MPPPRTPVRPKTPERYRPIAPAPQTTTHSRYFPDESFYTEPEDWSLSYSGGPRVLDPSIGHIYTMAPMEELMYYNYSMIQQSGLLHYEAPSMMPYWRTDSDPLAQSLRSDSDDSQIEPENRPPQHATGDAEKLVKCDKCSKWISRHNYKRHRISGCQGVEHKKTYQCECGETFSRQDSLNRHRGVSKDSPKKRQSCCPGIHAQIRGTCLRERCLLAQCMLLTLEQGF